MVDIFYIYCTESQIQENPYQAYHENHKQKLMHVKLKSKIRRIKILTEKSLENEKKYKNIKIEICSVTSELLQNNILCLATVSSVSKNYEPTTYNGITFKQSVKPHSNDDRRTKKATSH